MNLNKTVQVTYFLLRVVAGLLFFQVGALKIFGWFGGMPGGGTPPLMSQIGIGGYSKSLVASPSCWVCSRGRSHLSFRARWRLPIGSFTRPMPHGLFKTKADPRSCFVYLPVHGRTRCRRVEPRRAHSSQTWGMKKVDWIEGHNI
jgi:hypothetical protein